MLDRIRDLHRQAALLGQAYDKSLDQVRASVSGDAEADRAVDDLSLTARLSQARLSGRVQGLYMAGGPLAVYSTLMSSGSLADLADRTAMARRVLQADMFQASEGQTRVDRASAHAKVTSTAVIERTRAEHTLAELSRRLHETLSEQQDVMKLLRTRLDKVKAHEAEMARQAELARQARAREAARLKMQADSEQAMQMSMQQAVSAVQSMLDQQQAATDALEQQQQQQHQQQERPSMTLPVPVGTRATPCPSGTEATTGDRLSPQARCVEKQIMARFRYVRTVGGCCGNGSGRGDHPTGHAVDFMLSYGKTSPLVKAEGDYLAAWIMVNKEALHVKYMGWWQHIWYPDSRGWQEECMPSFKTCGMDGPPTVTAMHEDHVHVSVY